MTTTRSPSEALAARMRRGELLGGGAVVVAGERALARGVKGSEVAAGGAGAVAGVFVDEPGLFEQSGGAGGAGLVADVDELDGFGDGRHGQHLRSFVGLPGLAMSG